MSGAVAALEHGEDTVVEMIDEFHARRDSTLDELNRLPGVSCDCCLSSSTAILGADGDGSAGQATPAPTAWGKWMGPADMAAV